MSAAKRRVRNELREAALKRDGNRCRMCKAAVGEVSPNPDGILCEYLDAHHITPRGRMPNGGYVVENVITLCNDCHITAEEYLDGTGLAEDYAEDLLRFRPSALYALIGSSYEMAIAACGAR